MAADSIAVGAYLDCGTVGDADGFATGVAADVHAVGLPGGVELESLTEYRAFVTDVLGRLQQLGVLREDLTAIAPTTDD
jgi:hypothetical protein